MDNSVLDTHQKALAFNLDPCIYGTIAEIGAGQETARWFFKVGAAAGSIAKSISAYDMKFSDSIYGTCNRYVSRERLHAMLEKEYGLLIDRLGYTRGKECAFFSFANTVATYSHARRQFGHGWLGIRFQTRPGEQASQIDLHVVLKGNFAAQDQDVLGIIGVNLIHGARYRSHDAIALLKSLRDNISFDQLEIDMVDFSGPAFAEIDNRLMALMLVQLGMTPVALFKANGKLVQPSDFLYKKAVLVERSRFRPPTKLTINLLDGAYDAFCNESDVKRDEVVVLSEMTLENLTSSDDINVEDFLQRVDILCALGKNVMISSYAEFYRLAQYLFKQTSKSVAIALGIPNLRRIFEEHYYENLEGGILESMGRMFRNDMRLYVCPMIEHDGSLTTVDNLKVANQLQHLYSHLLENGYIRHLESILPEHLLIHSDIVLENIRSGNVAWKTMVPPAVVNIITERGLFNRES